MRNRLARTRRLAVVLIVLSAAMAVAGPAFGHAHVDRAWPGDGEELAVIPTAICVFFTEAVEASISRFEVFDAADQRVDDEEQTKAVNSGVTEHITVPLKAVGPGTYRVEWRVLSIDTHTTSGTWSFVVLPGARPWDDTQDDAGSLCDASST